MVRHLPALFSAMLALVSIVRSAWAEPVIANALRDETHGVTRVSEEPGVMANITIKMAPSIDPGDSLKWWQHREAGFHRWTEAKRLFPRVRSFAAESYLSALAEGFSRLLPPAPRQRFHFYVADTLNSSLWPMGGGFFVVHAGLFRLIREERQFAFVLALEMAHEALGHHVAWEGGWPRDGKFDSWSIEFWAALAGRDPIVRAGFAYSLQQESDALELVYRFFQANDWEYEKFSRGVASFLPNLDAVPGSSSLHRMHPHLVMAVRVPHDRLAVAREPVDSIVSPTTYAGAAAEIARSALQRYPWMLELVPYRDFVLDRASNIEQLRLRFDEHVAISSKRLEELGRRARNRSSDSELAELAARDEEHDGRDKLLSAKLARLYLRGLVLASHQRWQEVISNAAEGLKLAQTAEPFLWQRALARQQLGQFNTCIRELSSKWAYFDHRRELFEVQCTFLEGRYTEASRIGLEYRKRYPFDIDGAFWWILSEIRIKRVTDKQIQELEAFWGDRPIVRALKVFYYGYLGKPTQARAAVDFRADIAYGAQEWGILEFAQAWLRASFGAFAEDDRAEKLMQLSDLQWPLAHLVKYNLPREATERR